jgi:hypothetical protein
MRSVIILLNNDIHTASKLERQLGRREHLRQLP